MATEASTHLKLSHGQSNQIESGTAFPTTREDPMYIVGNGTGLDDGDIYYVAAKQVLGVFFGSAWSLIQLQSV